MASEKSGEISSEKVKPSVRIPVVGLISLGRQNLGGAHAVAKTLRKHLNVNTVAEIKQGGGEGRSLGEWEVGGGIKTEL